MALDGCGLVCKYTLFIFNLLFALVGFAFLGIGLWLRFSQGTRGIFEIEALNSSAFVMAVTVLITLGTVMLIVVVFGDYGACNEKRCALQVFSALLSILAIADITVGVIGFSNKAAVGKHIVEFYSSMYGLYVTGGDPVIGVTLVFIHSVLHCCGVTGFKVLELANDTCPAAKAVWENIKMPGCPAIILSVFDSKAQLMLGIFIGTGVLLITALVCTIILLKQTKRDQQAVTTYYSTVY
ncbi:CD9 antigen isoform X2 [Cyclopterus lumpus]|uniref:Tetraspanin n=1 Tax=Cyclopterus lumpus TaxID=8103 RepID=A0A8C3AR24_CYCLU|nr:CD9 antigen isoform X2 [Cyclopterus lumpus]